MKKRLCQNHSNYYRTNKIKRKKRKKKGINLLKKNLVQNSLSIAKNTTKKPSFPNLVLDNRLVARKKKKNKFYIEKKSK